MWLEGVHQEGLVREQPLRSLIQISLAVVIELYTCMHAHTYVTLLRLCGTGARAPSSQRRSGATRSGTRAASDSSGPSKLFVLCLCLIISDIVARLLLRRHQIFAYARCMNWREEINAMQGGRTRRWHGSGAVAMRRSYGLASSCGSARAFFFCNASCTSPHTCCA